VKIKSNKINYYIVNNAVTVGSRELTAVGQFRKKKKLMKV